MGNICRSPTAEAVMRGMLREHGLDDVVEVDSAGLGDWHAGQPPDHRAAAAASARGLTLEGTARAITGRDFEDYDLILAADRRNLRDLRAIAPRAAREKLHLLREFDPASAGAPDLDVPDPYYGGDDGFMRVLDLVEHRLRAVLPHAGLDAAGRRAVEAVAARIDELAGPSEPPARLHGDLWSGNVLAGPDGRARLIDPAAHGGHREVDLAMLRLFGHPAPRTLAAYQEAHPLADGHEQRVPLWQLFPLLVHAALFGGGYRSAVTEAARRAAA